VTPDPQARHWLRVPQGYVSNDGFSCRGSICIARQKVQVGIGHAGRTVTVEEAGTTVRVYDGHQLLTEVLRTSTRQIVRFKARKPETFQPPQ